MALRVTLNGQPRELADLGEGATLNAVVEALELKQDRIAIELRGEIAPRRTWATAAVADGDKLEIVHFVGGGRDAASCER